MKSKLEAQDDGRGKVDHAMSANTASKTEPQPCDVLYVEDDDAAAYLFQHDLEEAGVRLRLFR